MAKKQQTVTKKQPQTAPFYFQCHKPDESTRKQPAVYGVSDLESIKKNGVEGYDAVVLVDVKTNQITAISNVLDCSMEDVRKTPLHLQAAQAALKGEIYSYEWGVDKGSTHTFYQTTLVPLRGDDGGITTLLSLTRDITHWGSAYRGGYMLREGGVPRTFSQILLAARENEKREISKALHDEIGSTAVILTALLSLVKASVKENDKKQALEEIAKLDAQIKESIERVKNIVVSLRPPALDNDGGLGGSVRELLENISELVHIPYTFDYDPKDNKITVSDEVKILLYRIVQESLNNIVKHAQAKHIYVLLKRDEHTVHLVVADDGVGFKQTKQRSIRKVGLLAMQDSVQLLGGAISIKSTPGKGTRIEVECPCVVYGGER